MKILKQGNPPDPRRPVIFLCKNCGCKFEAYKDEYKLQYNQREIEWWYEVKCPCCDQLVTKEAS